MGPGFQRRAVPLKGELRAAAPYLRCYQLVRSKVLQEVLLGKHIAAVLRLVKAQDFDLRVQQEAGGRPTAR